MTISLVLILMVRRQVFWLPNPPAPSHPPMREDSGHCRVRSGDSGGSAPEFHGLPFAYRMGNANKSRLVCQVQKYSWAVVARMSA